MLEKRLVGVEAGVSGEDPHPFEQEWRHLPAADAGGCGIRQGKHEGGVVNVSGEFTLDRDRIGNDDAGGESEPEVGSDRGGSLGRRIASGIDPESAGSAVEGWKLVGAQAEYGDPERLEHLAGAGQVEDRLGSRADDRDRVVSQGWDVG